MLISPQNPGGKEIGGRQDYGEEEVSMHMDCSQTCLVEKGPARPYETRAGPHVLILLVDVAWEFMSEGLGIAHGPIGEFLPMLP